MPQRLVTWIAHPRPCTHLALPRIVPQQQPDQLSLLPFAEWEEGGEYDEKPLTSAT